MTVNIPFALEGHGREFLPTGINSVLKHSIGDPIDIHNTAVLNHAGESSDGVGPVAKAEQVEMVSWLVHVNEFGIQITNILRKPPPERSAEYSQGE